MICLGGGVESLPIILQAAKDFTPIVLDRNPESPGALWAKANPKKADYWPANPYSPISCRQQAQMALRYQQKRGKAYDIAGVLCCATDTPDSQVVLASEFSLPNMGGYAAELAKDKWEQLVALNKIGARVPKSWMAGISVEDTGEYDLIKPRVSRGARGVQRLIPSQYRRQLIEAISNSDTGYKQAILQKFIVGPQLSTESVIYNGQIVFTSIALRNYDTPYAPYIIENGSDCPFNLSVDQRSQLETLVLRASLSLGWNNCTVKGDLVLGEDGIYIIELAPRLSGGLFCSHITPLAYGYDFVDAAIRMAVGKKPKPYEATPMRAVCQRFAFPKPEWIGKKLTKVYEQDLTNTIDTSVTPTVYKSIGDKLDPVTYHGARLAQVIAVANTQDHARRKAEAMISEMESQFDAE